MQAAKFIMSTLPDDTPSEQETLTQYQCTRVIEKVYGYCKGIGKERKNVMAMKRDLMAAETITSDDVSIF